MLLCIDLVSASCRITVVPPRASAVIAVKIFVYQASPRRGKSGAELLKFIHFFVERTRITGQPCRRQRCGTIRSRNETHTHATAVATRARDAFGSARVCLGSAMRGACYEPGFECQTLEAQRFHHASFHNELRAAPFWRALHVAYCEPAPPRPFRSGHTQ